MADYNLHVRLKEKTDADVIAWLEAQKNKSEAVRDALRAAITPSALDLAAIRNILEAVLDERLAGLSLTGGCCELPEQSETSRASERLRSMF